MHKKKSSKTASKLLAAMLAAAMSLTLLPTTAMAVEGSTREGEGDLVLNKTATLTDNGTYTIDLEAYATGESVTIKTTKPTDVVLVLDVSGSMADNYTYVSGEAWVSVKDYVRDTPSDAHHLCADGTYSPVTWTKEGTANSTVRYTCDRCKATRKWSVPLWNRIPGEGDDDSWNLWRYTQTTTTKPRIEALQEAANAFIDGVAQKNAELTDPEQLHRVAIVKFADDSYGEDNKNTFNESGYNHTQTVKTLTVVDDSTKTELTDAIDALVAAGATAADYGLNKATAALGNLNDGREKVVILFTDGEPNHQSGFDTTVATDTVNSALTLKNGGAKIYTISTFDNPDPADTSSNMNKYMNAVSSNYPTASATGNFNVTLGAGGNNGYYKAANDSKQLSDIFTEISESIGTTTVTLDENSVTKDILADGFILPEGYTANSVTVAVDAYSGRDRDGNRVFANAPQALTGAVVDIGRNSIGISGFDFAGECLIDGDKPNDNDFTAAKQGKKLVITITGVEAADITETDKAVNTNDALSGIYENAASANPAAVFPIPQTIFKSKAFVLDYAKPVTLNASNWGMTSTTKIGGDMAANQAAVSTQYGNAEVEGGSSLTYTPDMMAWGGYDSFYVFGKTTDSSVTAVEANRNGNLWSKISLLPANNVYFEDTFESIAYSDGWKQDQEGSNDVAVKNDSANAVHGWIASMADDETYSDGTAAYSNTANSTATFTFTGTGVDVYSRTNSGTGYVKAQLSQNGKLIKSQVVNSQSVSGDYYQIPTISFSGLEHGTYTVKLTVGTSANYYLDGIRVYNPLSEAQENDSVVSVAYGDEIGATFMEVRDVLLDAESFGTTTEGQGVVFIDHLKGGSSDVGTYEDYGPKNEVYLSSEQAIVFNVVDPDANYYIGLKAPAGATKATVTDDDGKTKDVNIGAASDLYYAITPSSEGMIEIKNTGANLLSITKLRRTGDAPDAEVFGLLRVSDAVAYANSFESLSNISDGDSTVTEPETPEISKPDRPEHNKPQQKPGYHKDWFKNLFHGFGDWFRG